MELNLIEELDETIPRMLRGAQIDVAFFTTYTLNLRFFEQLILTRLRRLGAVHIGILADGFGYNSAFEDPLGQARCGREYVLEAQPHPRSLLHGKLLWLHSAKRDFIYVGSHNLTMPGYNDQLEDTVRLDSADPSHLYALQSIHATVDRLLIGCHSLSRLWQRVPTPIGERTEESPRFFSSLDSGLAPQLAEATGEVDQLIVVTPFLDASALGQLASMTGAKSIELRVPFQGADTSLAAARAALPEVILKRCPHNRTLHAKAYQAVTKDGTWLAVGSANCTQAGLIRPVNAGGNIEWLVLLPGAALDEREVPFDVISDPNQFPGTGRRWDEQAADDSHGLNVEWAVYEGGKLTLQWEAAERGDEDVLAIVDGIKYPIANSGDALEMPPPRSSILTLQVQRKSVVMEARAWIVFPDELNALVSGRSIARWSEYLASEDPSSYADGVDAFFEDLLLALFREEERPQTSRRTSSRSASDIKDIVEEVAYAHDEGGPELVSRLIIGDADVDPLAALAGLIVRLQVGSPSGTVRDESEVRDYFAGRERSSKRIINRLIQHLSRISSSEVDWASTASERVQFCLRGTFEATVVLWYRLIRTDASASERNRLGERMLTFLHLLRRSPAIQTICREVDVAGPLTLFLGVASEVIGEDVQEEGVPKVAHQLITDAAEALKEWEADSPVRAALVSAASGLSVPTLARPALHLLGFAGPATELRQQKWKTLVDLSSADQAGSPAADRIFLEAENQYGDEVVWRAYKQGRVAGAPPRVIFVRNSVCGKCFQMLPEIGRRRLDRGDAVSCGSCGTILLFGTRG